MPDSTITVSSRSSAPRTLLGKYDLFEDGIEDSWEKEISNGTVNSRAWVVQERLLAPRVLHFTQSQLYWECTDLQASESFPFGIEEYDFLEKRTPFKAINSFSLAITLNDIALKRGKLFGFRKSQSLEAPFDVWARAVKAFTSADLTYETDKLVAISAIAREMKPFMRCRYLAGHWETDLVHQLGWRAEIFSVTTRQKEYRAPSWSWASVNGEVAGFERMYCDFALAEVLEVQMELATSDEMGQVKGGLLKLRGHLIKVHWHTEEYGKIIISVNGHNTSMSIEDDNENNKIVHRKSRRLWCLPLIACGGSLDCLLLTKVRYKHNTFQRSGIVKCYMPAEDADKDFKNPFLKLAKDAEKMFNPFYRLIKTGANFFMVNRSSSSLREFKII